MRIRAASTTSAALAHGAFRCATTFISVCSQSASRGLQAIVLQPVARRFFGMPPPTVVRCSRSLRLSPGSEDSGKEQSAPRRRLAIRNREDSTSAVASRRRLHRRSSMARQVLRRASLSSQCKCRLRRCRNARMRRRASDDDACARGTRPRRPFRRHRLSLAHKRRENARKRRSNRRRPANFSMLSNGSANQRFLPDRC